MPRVRVVMTDRDVVERVAALFQRAVTSLRVKRSHHKTPFATAIKGSAAVELMRAVRPHVGEGRQEQIDVAITSWNRAPARRAHASGICTEPACARPAAVMGLCRQHYKGWWKAQKHGRRATATPRPVEVRYPLVEPGQCGEADVVAWLAGLLEGEGHFGITRSGTWAYPTIKLEMCAESVVRRAATILGAPSVTREEPRKDRWSPTYVAAISGSAAAEWMLRLRPLMGHRRGEAIDAALAAYRPIRLVDPPTTCVVPGCGKPHRGRGLCHAHYMAWSRDVAKGRTPRVTPLR